MSILPLAPDYTDKDFSALKERLIHLIQAVFPTWTDFNRTDFGNILLESFCFCLDILSFYQDQQAKETRWGSAQLRESIIELARLIGYELDGANAASGTINVTLTRTVSPGGDVTFPAFTTFVKSLDVQNPPRYQFLTELVISAGSTTGSVTAENSETQEDNFTALGEADEAYVLTQVPFLDDSISMTIGGDLWTEVDNFLDSLATDKHFVVTVDANDMATIQVGDGNNGLIPSQGSPVIVGYKTGGGTSGNVEAGSLTKIEGGPFSDAYGNIVQVAVTNPSAISNGTNRETVDQARVQAPASLRVLNRAVARTDYEDIAIRIPGVARAFMVTRNEDSSINYGLGYMHIIPVGGGIPDPSLLTTVKSSIDTNYPSTLTFSWSAINPIYKTVNIVVWVYMSPDYTEATVEQNILALLRAYFNPQTSNGQPNEQINFGFYYKDNDGDPDPKVSWSRIGDIIDDAEGVRRLGTPGDTEGLTLNGSMSDVDLLTREFPTGGTLSIWNGDTGSLFANCDPTPFTI